LFAERRRVCYNRAERPFCGKEDAVEVWTFTSEQEALGTLAIAARIWNRHCAAMARELDQELVRLRREAREAEYAREETETDDDESFGHSQRLAQLNNARRAVESQANDLRRGFEQEHKLYFIDDRLAHRLCALVREAPNWVSVIIGFQVIEGSPMGAVGPLSNLLRNLRWNRLRISWREPAYYVLHDS